MKYLSMLVLVILALSCSQRSGNGDLVSTSPFLMGKWTGDGRFFDTDLNTEVGLVRIEIEIKGDSAIHGKIGEAQMINTSIAKAKYGFAIKGELDSKLKKGMDLDKKYLVILLVLPEEGRADVTTSDANFHLKSNYAFDLSMRVGGVMLTKEP